ncbi:MAG: hypothetical protein Q4C50_09150 [Eubacteriales bacterium]|nr:hypothetical protein [Eubacteriales bacterium]
MNRNRKRKTEIGVTALAAVLLSAGAVQGVAQNTQETRKQETVKVEAQPVRETEPETNSEKQDTAKTGNTEDKKSETVYVIADASGSTQEVIVEEWLKNVEGLESMNDRSDLTDIENVEGEETFTQDGGKIVWDAKGNDIHYQGNSEKELPVSVHITYYLDGREISPEELAGKSGEVTIRYDYTNREKKKVELSGEKKSVYVPFTVMSGMIFTDNCVKDVSINSGKVITSDDKTVVVGVAFPGLKDSLKFEKEDEDDPDIDLDIPDYVEVTFTAEDFEMEMSASLVMSDLFNDLDLEREDDRKELTDAIEELTDGAQELAGGSSDLADGVGELYDKLPDLTDGVQSLKDGVVEYTDGVSSVDSGVSELKSGSSRLVSGVSELSSGAGSLADGAGSLADGAKTLASGTKDMKAGVSGAKSGSEQLLNGYLGQNGAVAGAKTLADGAKQLDGGMDALVSGADTLINGAGTLASGLTSVNEGAVLLDNGAGKLQGGAKELSQGTQQLAVSSTELVSAVETVGKTLKELQIKLNEEGTQTADQIENLKAALAQISETIGSDEDGENIRDCYDAIAADVKTLDSYYCENDPEGYSYRPQSEISAAETDLAGLDALKDSAAASKTAADEAAGNAAMYNEQAGAAAGSAGASLASAADSRAAAAGQADSANTYYQGAMGAYEPLLSDIKNTLGKVGLSKYAGYVDDGLGTAATAAGAYENAVSGYQAAAQNYEAAAGEYENAASGYQTAAQSYETAIAAYKQTIANYEAVIAQYEEALAGQTMAEAQTFEAAQAKSEEPADTITDQQVQAAWEDLRENVEMLSALESRDAESTQGLTDSLDALETTLFGDEENSGAFKELSDAVNQLYAGDDGSETADTITILDGAKALQAGNAQIAKETKSLVSGIDDLREGTTKLAAGTGRLAEGVSSLTDGAGSFAEGVESAKAGSSQLSAGAGQLYLGISQLYLGTKELDGGLEALSFGAYNLDAGAKSLSSGAKTLSKGADALASGTGTLSSGANALDSGVSSLQSGVSELSANSPKLIDGADELADGTDELTDGVEELKDGADELADGMEEFNEDGIKKLKEIFVDDLDEFIERLQAIQDAGSAYQSFAGIPDDMNGDVKFIIKTEGILSE